MSEMNVSYSKQNAPGIRIAVKNELDAEVGHAYIYCILNEPRNKSYALLDDVFVLETERKKGIGNMLLEEAIKVVKEQGCYKIIATSRFLREEVHTWYERKGFEKFGYEFRMNLDQGTIIKEQ